MSSEIRSITMKVRGLWSPTPRRGSRLARILAAYRRGAGASVAVAGHRWRVEHLEISITVEAKVTWLAVLRRGADVLTV